MKLEVLCILETLPLSLDNAQVQSHCNIYAQFSAYQRNVVHFTVIVRKSLQFSWACSAYVAQFRSWQQLGVII